MTEAAADRSFAAFARTGDPAELARVFDLVEPELLRVAMHLARQPAEAEDLLQATFVSAIESANRWDPERPVMPWLLGILANHARKARSRRTPASLGEVERADPAASPPRAAERGELTAEVRRAIDAQPEPYRRALLLHLSHGLAPIEIAHLFDVPPPTARSWIRRGLERLRKDLPAGLAGAAVLGFSAERGLAAVRKSVLALAGGGSLVVKKLVFVAIAVLCLAGGTALVLTRPPAGDAPRPAPRPDPTVAGAPEEENGETPFAPPVDFGTVDRERDVFGVVVDSRGDGIPGARVVVARPPWRMPHAGSRRLGLRDGPEATTSIDGTFRIPLDPGRDYRLRVEAARFAPVRLLVQAGERVRVVMAGTTGDPIRVRVRDERGAPVADADVHLDAHVGREWLPDCVRTTNEEGIALLPGLPAEWEPTLAVRHSSHAPVDGLRVAPGDETVAVLPDGVRVRGRVVDDATGEPVTGAEVSDRDRFERRVRTDALGAFDFPGIRDPAEKGESHLLVTADGYAPRGVVVSPGSATMEVRLVRAPSIAGRIVDEAGVPVAGALVSAGGSGVPTGSFESRATSEEDGRFRLAGLPVRSGGVLVATAPGRGRLLYYYPPPGPPGREIDFGDLVLAPGGAVSGRVRAADGEPLAGAFVQLMGGNLDRGARLPAVTTGMWTRPEIRRADDLGRFRFADLAPGDYRLLVVGPDGATRTGEVRIERPGQEVSREVSFGAGREIRFVVTDGEGAGVAGVSLWTRTPRGDASAVTDEEGVAVLRAEGEVREVSITPPDEEWLTPWRFRGRSIGPEEDVVRVEVYRATRVDGVVEGPDGRPAPDVKVRCEIDGKPLLPARTDAEGRFSLEVPARRPFDLVAETNEEAGAIRDVRAGGGEPRIRLAPIPRDQLLRVRVEDPDGRPLEGVLVSFQVAGDFPVLRTDACGRVRFEDRTDRPGWLRTQGGGPSSLTELAPPRSVQVTPGDEEVVLRYRRTVEVRGEVAGDDGRPAAGVRVYAIDPETHEAFGGLAGETDGSGRFVIRAPGELDALTIYAYVGRPGQVPEVKGTRSGVRPGARDVRIRLGEER